MSEKIRSIVSKARAASAPPRDEMVSFDPRDGKKRVLITVGVDGTFEPINFYGVGHGIFEASNIAAHGALILTEHIWREAVSHGE